MTTRPAVEKSDTQITRLAAFVALGFIASFAGSADAATLTWTNVGGVADWSTVTRWTTTGDVNTNPGAGPVPDADDIADIRVTSGGTNLLQVTGAQFAGQVLLTRGNDARLDITSTGSLTVTAPAVGDGDGTLELGNFDSGFETARVNLAGVLITDATLVGADDNIAGIFNHTAGSHTTGALSINTENDDTVATSNVGGSSYNISGNSTLDVNGRLFVNYGVGGGDSDDPLFGRLNIVGSQATIMAEEYEQAALDAFNYGELIFTADAGGVSLIDVDGPVSLDGVLEVTLDALVGSPAEIFLIDNDNIDPIAGDLFDLVTINDSQVRGYSLSYTGGDGNDLTLQLPAQEVPEPHSIAIWGLLALGLAGYPRYRLWRV